MRARSSRTKQEKLQRVGLLQQYEFLSSSSTPPLPMSSFAYPPIFLSPSSFDPFTPSPSPLPAAGAHHSSVPKAAIIGGSIAGVVTLAVTASVISAVTGKVGLACLLGPVYKLFSCLFGKFTAPCSAKLKSLFSTLNKWNPADKSASNKAANSNGDAGADDCGGMNLYEILGGSPNTMNKAESGAAAAAHSLAKSPVQNVLKGNGDQLGTSAQYTFFMTSVSDFAESELKQQKEKMLKPLNPHIAKAQGFAQSLLSVTENVSDDLRALQQSADAHLNEVSKLKANADHMKASTEGIAAAWKNPGDAAVLMFDEAIRVGAEKTKATITNEHAAGMKRLHERLQEPIIVEEEVVLHRLLGKPNRTRGKESHELEEEEEEEEEEAAAKQQVVLGGNGPVCIVESASDASTLELQLQEKGATSYTQLAQVPHIKDIEIGGAAAVHHNPAGSISNMALVPTTDTGDNVQTISRPPATTGGSLVAVPTKAIVPGRTMTSAAWPQASEDDVQGKHMIARGKRPSNLGHVSFSCEISAHRLRFFTSCRSGGTYGSPPPSPAPAPVPHHPNYDHHTSNNFHTITNTSNNLSHANRPANTANYYVPWYNEVQLADTRASTATHYSNLIHQPAHSILMQSNTAASPSTQHTARLSPLLDNKPHSENYGCPFDGVL